MLNSVCHITGEQNAQRFKVLPTRTAVRLALKKYGFVLLPIGLSRRQGKDVVDVFKKAVLNNEVVAINLQRSVRGVQDEPRLQTMYKVSKNFAAVPGVQRLLQKIGKLCAVSDSQLYNFRQYVGIRSGEMSKAQIARADNISEGLLTGVHEFMTCPCNVLLPTVQLSQLDIRPLHARVGHLRVDIPLGHCLVFRGDVVHRGVAGVVGDGYNYRLFCHMVPLN